MALDPYVSCPCGSGKKFKWCCASYYPEVEKAFALEQQNQHESALATMKELTTKYGDKPPVWGYYAQFLYNSGMREQAEEAVRLANARFSAGTATQLDILQTQVALTDARLNQLRAYYTFNVAVVTLRRAMGLPDELITKSGS